MPPLKVSIPLALQHVLTMFSANITVSLVLATSIGLALNDVAFILQCAMFTAGVTTFVQAFGLGPVGSKLPIMMGSSFAFLGVSIAIAGDPALGMGALFGAVIVGGVTEALLGSVLLRAFKRFFTPIVTGSVVMAIGLSLLGTGVDYCAGGAGAANYGGLQNLGVALFTLVVALVLNQLGKGFIKAASIFIALIAGFALAWALGMVDLTPVLEAGWFAVPIPLKWGVSFKLSAIIPMLFIYLVSLLEFVGDTTGVAINAANRMPTNRELRSGVLCDGLGSAFSGLFNCTPNVSFSQNVGLIGITGVKSRFIVVIGGIILFLLSFIPKFGMIFALIPSSVLGGTMIAMFGMIVVSGMKVVTMQKLTQRNTMILAIALGLGMGINSQVAAVARLPSIVQTLLTGVAGTGLIALLLNIILPAKEKDFYSMEEEPAAKEAEIESLPEAESPAP